VRRDVGRLECSSIRAEIRLIPDVTDVKAADARVSDILEVERDGRGSVQTIEE